MNDSMLLFIWPLGCCKRERVSIYVCAFVYVVVVAAAAAAVVARMLLSVSAAALQHTCMRCHSLSLSLSCVCVIM
jgi:hypothetical protein